MPSIRVFYGMLWRRPEIIFSAMRPKSIFGSSDALERWVDGFNRHRNSVESFRSNLPIDCGPSHDQYPCQSLIRRRRQRISDNSFEVYFGNGPDPLSFLKSRFSSSLELPVADQHLKPSVWSVWMEAKYAPTPMREVSTDKYYWDDSLSTCDPVITSESSSDLSSSITPDAILSILTPTYSKPARNCSVCNAAILSARAVMNPPGYCEYSGDMICGDCFYSRELVIPWKLVQGFDTFRGNVSRKSADIIHANFYAVCIPYSQLSQLAAIRSVQSIRIRCQTFRPKITVCDELREKAIQVIASLPAHFRDELLGNQTKTCLDYCLADLVDIVGGSSIIGRTFISCLALLDSHNCSNCERMFSKTCVLCTHKVSCTDIEWTYCDDCESWFHRTCHSRCIGGCPVCANRMPLNTIFSLDDISDLVVSS